MNTEEKTLPLNEVELKALDGVLGEVTSDQVAEVIKVDGEWYHNGKRTHRAYWLVDDIAQDLADLYEAADPSFDREEFLRRCGV